MILHDRNGVTEEPFESLVVEVPHDKLGAVMEMVGGRRGKIVEMNSRGEFAHAMFSIPARGLIGLRTRLLNATQGMAIMHHRFEAYRPLEGEIAGRGNGVLVSMMAGKAVAFGLDGLQERAEMFVGPGDEVYEGMIVGENSRTGDMAVNPTKEKKLTNMRASGSDRNILLKPPRVLTLGNGAGIHRRRRAGRSHARQHPAKENAAQRKRPQESIAAQGVVAHPLSHSLHHASLATRSDRFQVVCAAAGSSAASLGA